MQERRELPRRRTFLGARLAFNNQYCGIDCLVRDLTRDGARLVFKGPALLPGEFDLQLPQRGEQRRARIVWRQQDQAGVTFVAGGEEAVVSIAMARRIKKLEAERAALEARVAQLSEML
jgi:hypothetical protein